MSSRNGHQACVDAWLLRTSAQSLPREVLLDLFEAALVSLWSRTTTTLGEVTLTAIADRVLHNAVQSFPAFASLRVEPNGRIHSRELRGTAGSLSQRELLRGMRLVLVEFMTVLGNLTAELLTPELHAELTAVVPDPAAGNVPRRSSRTSGKTAAEDRP